MLVSHLLISGEQSYSYDMSAEKRREEEYLLHRYYQWPGSWEQLRVGPWMWRGDKETDEETIGLIFSLAPPSFQGSVGLARLALSVRDHNGIGLWMCVMGVLLLETGAQALSCSPRFQHVGRQRIYVAPWHIKSLPSCRRVIQNTPRMKHPIIGKGVEREWETENKGEWFPETSGSNTKSDNAGTEKGTERFGCVGVGGGVTIGQASDCFLCAQYKGLQRLATEQTGVLS